MTNAHGIDVSNYQGQFDWAATTGLSFGICKATQSTDFTDPDLSWNWAQISAKRLVRGAYHFLSPSVSGSSQAQYFVNALKPLGLADTDILVLDHETAGSTVPGTAEVARAFMSELRSLRPSNPPVVYTYVSFAQQGYCAGLGSYPLWIADYASSPAVPSPWTTWQLWQYSDSVSQGGQDVDGDEYNGTSPQLSAWTRSFGGPDMSTLPGIWKTIISKAPASGGKAGDYVVTGIGDDDNLWEVYWTASTGRWGAPYEIATVTWAPGHAP